MIDEQVEIFRNFLGEFIVVAYKDDCGVRSLKGVLKSAENGFLLVESFGKNNLISISQIVRVKQPKDTGGGF